MQTNLLTGQSPAAQPDQTTERPADSYIDGERVAQIMRLRGINQRQLADAIQVSEAHVSRMLRKRIESRLSTMRKLAWALKVPIIELTPAGQSMTDLEQMLFGESAKEEAARQRLEQERQAARRAEDAISEAGLTVVESWGQAPAQSGDLGFRGSFVPLPKYSVRGLGHPFVVEANRSVEFPGVEPIRRHEQVLLDANGRFEDGDLVLVEVNGSEVFRLVAGHSSETIDLIDEADERRSYPREAVRLLGKAITVFSQRPAPRAGTVALINQPAIS